MHPEFDWPPLWVPRQNHPLWLGANEARDAPNGISDELLDELLKNCTFGAENAPMGHDVWRTYDREKESQFHSDTERAHELVGPMQAKMNQQSWMSRTECRKQPLAMLWDVRNASGARDVWTALDRIRGGAEVFLRDGVGAREQRGEKWDEIGWSPHACWQAWHVWEACTTAKKKLGELQERNDWRTADKVKDLRERFCTPAGTPWIDVWTTAGLNQGDLRVWEVAIDVLHDFYKLKRLTPQQKRLRMLRIPLAEANVADAELGRHLSAGERYVSSVGRNQPTSWDPTGDSKALHENDEDAGFGNTGYGARVGEGAAGRDRFHSLVWWRWKWNHAGKLGDQFVAGYAGRFNYNASLAMGAGDPFGKITFAADVRETMAKYAMRTIARNELEFGRQLQLAAGLLADPVRQIEDKGVRRPEVGGVQRALVPATVSAMDKETKQRTFEQRTGGGGFYATWFVPTGTNSLAQTANDMRLFLRRDPNGDLYFPQHVDLQYMKPETNSEAAFWKQMLTEASDDWKFASETTLQRPSPARTPRINFGNLMGGARELRHPPKYTERDEQRMRETLGDERADTLLARRLPDAEGTPILPGSFTAGGPVATGRTDVALTVVIPIMLHAEMVGGATTVLLASMKKQLKDKGRSDADARLKAQLN